MNYIGVDCHISSLDFAVVNERGITTKRAKVNTGVKEFIDFVKAVCEHNLFSGRLISISTAVTGVFSSADNMTK